jgi:hypothetical protein
MEDDDKQVYFTKETWAVLERLEELGFCKPRERYVLARIAIAVALARGLETSPEDMKGRDSHYQLDQLEPMKYAIRWRFPEETRPYWRMSNLAHAGCAFLRNVHKNLMAIFHLLRLSQRMLKLISNPGLELMMSLSSTIPTLIKENGQVTLRCRWDWAL